MNIEVGTVVHLKSGGPAMTVFAINADDAMALVGFFHPNTGHLITEEEVPLAVLVAASAEYNG